MPGDQDHVEYWDPRPTPSAARERPIAVLFARADSVYHTIPGCDVWDFARDARRWPGGCPAVAHPPCRARGKLKHFAKPRPDEKDLARFAVRMLRAHGGVLEHPARSGLWQDMGLPAPGRRPDAYGGWSFAAPQFWWGHRADKATWFYIVGCQPASLPTVPFVLGEAPCVICSSSYARGRAASRGGKSGMSKANRERTPPALAHWLVELARRCTPISILT